MISKKGIFKPLLSLALILTIILTALPFTAFTAKAASKMKTSASGIEMIKSFEGFLEYAIWDYGQWSIGYGTGVPEGQYPNGITREEAEILLRQYLDYFEDCLNKFTDDYNVVLNQNQFDALVSFTFNCGAGNLKNLTQSGKRTLEQISAKILLYNKAGGVVLRGLQRRRAAEKELFDTPIKSDKADIKYYPKYTGDSPRVDEVLYAIGAYSDYDMVQTKSYLRRKPIATANGIKNYSGTAAQNNKIIKLAKDGILRRV
jgi:GH24 family phage-related lysozyme (muramidase)